MTPWLRRILAASLRDANSPTPELRVALTELASDPHATSLLTELLAPEVLETRVRGLLLDHLRTSPHRALRALSLLDEARAARTVQAARRFASLHPDEATELVLAGAAPMLAAPLLQELVPLHLTFDGAVTPAEEELDAFSLQRVEECATILADHLPRSHPRTHTLRALLRLLDAHLLRGESWPAALTDLVPALLQRTPELAHLPRALRAPLAWVGVGDDELSLACYRASLLRDALEHAALAPSSLPDTLGDPALRSAWRGLADRLDLGPSHLRALHTTQWGSQITSSLLRKQILITALEAPRYLSPRTLSLEDALRGVEFLLGEVHRDEWLVAAGAAGIPLPPGLCRDHVVDPAVSSSLLAPLALRYLRLRDAVLDPEASSETSAAGAEAAKLLDALRARIPLADEAECADAADLLAECCAAPLPLDVLDELLVLADPYHLDSELEELPASPEHDAYFVEVAARLPYVCDPDELADRADPESVAAALAQRLLDPSWDSIAARGFAEDERDLGEWRGRAILAAAQFTELSDADLCSIPWPAYVEAAALEDARRLEGRLARILTARFGADPTPWRSFDVCAESCTTTLGELLDLVCDLCAEPAADPPRSVRRVA